MYIPALTNFFTASAADKRLNSDHIIIYMALFQKWNLNGFRNPVSVSRTQLLKLSKLPKMSYHKCMRELHEYGYIKYIPTFHSVLGSLVYMDMFSRKTELTGEKAKNIPDNKVL